MSVVGLHVELWHEDPWQLCPQAPQLLASLVRSEHVPLQQGALPEHDVPGGALAQAHAWLVQLDTAHGRGGQSAAELQGTTQFPIPSHVVPLSTAQGTPAEAYVAVQQCCIHAQSKVMQLVLTPQSTATLQMVPWFIGSEVQPPSGPGAAPPPPLLEVVVPLVEVVVPLVEVDVP
jgi:hypothetical protein